MYDKRKGFFVGIFVLGAICVLLVGLFLFGAGSLFHSSERFVVFFDGSVKGLKPGAAVTFRGVRVGEVVDVNLQIDHTEQTVRIPTVFEIYPETVLEVGKRPEDGEEMIRIMIEQGLRAQLEMESFVTGILAINLDFHPDTKAQFVGHMTQFTEIPAIPSRLEQLSDLLEDIPLQEFVNEARTVVKRAADLLDSHEVDSIMEDFPIIIHDLRNTLEVASRLLTDVDGKVEPLARNLEEVLLEMRYAVKKISLIFDEVDGILSEESTSHGRIGEVLENISEAAVQLRQLAETLDRNPEALLLGK